jgi:hypothetical protein
MPIIADRQLQILWEHRSDANWSESDDGGDQLLSGVIGGYEKGETIDEAVVELGQIMKTKHQWASKFIYGDTHKLI